MGAHATDSNMFPKTVLGTYHMDELDPYHALDELPPESYRQAT